MPQVNRQETLDTDGRQNDPPDGEVDDRSTYYYYKDGRPIEGSQELPWGQLPNAVERLFIYSYNEEGLQIKIESFAESDQDPNGEPGTVTLYHYDGFRDMVCEQTDTDLDGLPESRTSYQYDENGNLITKTYFGQYPAIIVGGKETIAPCDEESETWDSRTVFNYDCWE